MEKEPFTKNDLCWVIVKLIGVIFLFQVVLTLVGSLLMAFDSGDGKIFFIGFVVSIIPLALGIYLMSSGAILHGWLMSVPSLKRKKAVEEMKLAEKRLSPEEFEKYENWLISQPNLSRFNEVDLLALFRDAQKRGDL